MLKPFFSIIQVRRNVTISDPPSGCWTFSRSVLWQIPWHYSGVKLLKLSLDTERKGEKEKTKEKPKWKRSRNLSGKKDSLKHWVQLIGCFCPLLSVYSFQHHDRRRLSTYENHDGRDRARRACTIRIITMKQIKSRLYHWWEHLIWSDLGTHFLWNERHF